MLSHCFAGNSPAAMISATWVRDVRGRARKARKASELQSPWSLMRCAGNGTVARSRQNNGADGGAGSQSKGRYYGRHRTKNGARNSGKRY